MTDANVFAGKIAAVIYPGYAASKFSLDGFCNSLRQQHIMRGGNVSTTLIIYGRIGNYSVNIFHLLAEEDALLISKSS